MTDDWLGGIVGMELESDVHRSIPWSYPTADLGYPKKVPGICVDLHIPPKPAWFQCTLKSKKFFLAK